MQIGKRQELGELGYGTESRSIPAQSKPTINLLSFTMTVLHAELRTLSTMWSLTLAPVAESSEVTKGCYW